MTNGNDLSVDEFDAICKKSIGMSVDEFKQLGYKYRIVKFDGNSCVVTCDFKPTRFNLTIINNKITENDGG